MGIGSHLLTIMIIFKHIPKSKSVNTLLQQLNLDPNSIYKYIGGLGELVRLVRPPITGRSASFRLRFRFVRAVRAVRAGEAKLRGRT